MKTILEWLHLAKEQGYEWADSAIMNYDPEFTTRKERESLKEALYGAFSWERSPEKKEFWHGVSESLRVTVSGDSTLIEYLIEDLGKLNNALGNLAYNDTLNEPYRTQVYEATKASYEEQLSEVKAKIAKSLGIEPPDVKQLMEELSILKRDFDRQLSYIQELEVENDGLSRELEAHKSTAEEVNRSYINEHNENYERMIKIEQLEKEIEFLKNRKLIGWVVQNEDGGYSKCTAPNFIKEDDGWFAIGGKNWSDITTEEAAALCDRLPKWSDNEPVAIYE